MKNLITLLSLLMAVSCVSNKYNIAENKGNFDQIQAGTRYAVYDLNNNKSIIEVTSVEKDSIMGTRKKQLISIAKKDIKEIKKIKTTGTIVLATFGTAVIATALVLINYSKESSPKPTNIGVNP